MAIFGMNKNKSAKGGSATGGKKEKKEVKAEVPATASNTTTKSNTTHDLSHVLSRARITEKASMQQLASVYTFDVSKRASKREIMAAVRAIYKVNPVKVAVVTIPAKQRRSMRTGKRGVSRGGRKAYVFLKKGETINIA